jgi:hypothetical protein
VLPPTASHTMQLRDSDRLSAFRPWRWNGFKRSDDMHLMAKLGRPSDYSQLFSARLFIPGLAFKKVKFPASARMTKSGSPKTRNVLCAIEPCRASQPRSLTFLQNLFVQPGFLFNRGGMAALLNMAIHAGVEIAFLLWRPVGHNHFCSGHRHHKPMHGNITDVIGISRPWPPSNVKPKRPDPASTKLGTTAIRQFGSV